MHKLKKAAAVAVMVGGIGLVGGGVANASAGHYDEPYPGDVAINNLQVVTCDQDFDGGSASIVPPVGTTVPSIGGDVEQNVGNFCTAVGGDIDED